jgi:hypothetical protein|tara:strand:+ start:254 stop:508 length:255 start_codon:yes stop_codon:yes gene_type:complete
MRQIIDIKITSSGTKHIYGIDKHYLQYRISKKELNIEDNVEVLLGQFIKGEKFFEGNHRCLKNVYTFGLQTKIHPKPMSQYIFA